MSSLDQMRPLRGALFGCGMISEYHLRAWRRIPEVEIVALCNRTIERAEERRRQFAPQAKTYDDLETMLTSEQLDFIDVLTPPDLHYQHCLLAARHEVHIICQKPLCDSLERAAELVDRMKAYDKIFAVHENHRYRPWFQETLRRMNEGFFGAPRLLRLEQYEPSAPPEAYKTDMKRAVLLEYGTHLVDMMRALLGEPRRVYARLHRINRQVRGESIAHVVYEYPETTAVIEIAWKPSGARQASVLVAGDRGEAYLEGTMTRGRSSRFRLMRGDDVVLDERHDPMDDYTQSFYLFQRECVDAMLNGGAITQTGAENLKTLACTFAAYQAAEQNEVVDTAECYERHVSSRTPPTKEEPYDEDL